MHVELAEPVIDCHCHIFDPLRFPYVPDAIYRPEGPEIGTADYFSRVLDTYGVRHALLVGPNSGYGTDNRCLLDAIAHGGGRFKGIAVVRNEVSRAELEQLRGQGIVGVAFNFALHGPAYYRNADGLLRHLADLDMFAQIQVEGPQLLAEAPRLLACGAQILIDHCGRPDVTAGVEEPGFQTLLALGKSDRAAVKLSGYAKFSQQPYPFADTEPFIARLLDSFGPDGCIWASDWPFLRAPFRIDYGPLLKLAERTLADPGDRRRVMWETPRRLFGFSAS